MVINGKGYQYIFYSYFYKNPSEVLVNGKEKNLVQIDVIWIII